MSSIVHIKPKSNVVNYGGYIITTTFDPGPKRWHSHAVKQVTTTVELVREGKTINFAISLAKRAIDRINDQNTRAG